MSNGDEDDPLRAWRQGLAGGGGGVQPKTPDSGPGAVPRYKGTDVPVPPRLRGYYKLGSEAQELVTGEEATDPKYKNAQEFQQVAMSGRTFLAGLMAKDPKHAQQIIIKAFPGAEAFEDAKGNPMVRFSPGEGQPVKEFYVNKPGLSEADMFSLAGDILTFVPAGRIFGAASRLPGLGGAAGRVALPATAASTRTVAQDVASAGLGSDFDPAQTGTNALINAGLGAAGEVAGRMLGTTPRTRLPAPDLAEGRRMVIEAGLNPEAYTDANLRSVSRLRYMPAGEDRSSAVRSAASYMRGDHIPLTRGQRSGNWQQLEGETRVRNYPGGSQVMQYFDEGLQDVAINQRGRQLVGGHETDEAIGARLRSEVERLRRRHWDDEVQTRYANVDLDGLRFDRDTSQDMMNNVRTRLGDVADAVSTETAPNAQRALEIVRTNVRQPRIDPNTGRQMVDWQGNPMFEGVELSLGDAEQLRRRINALVPQEGGVDRTAVLRIRNAIDDFIDDNIAAGRFTGDASQVPAVRDARASARRHYQLFEANNEYDTGGKIVSQWNRQGPQPSVGPAGNVANPPPAPPVTGQQTIADVYGPPGSELSGYGDQPAIVGRLQQIGGLDPNSTINEDLRNAAKYRMIYGRNVDATDTAPKAVAGRIQRGVGSQGVGLTDTLLTDAERRELLQYAEDLDQLSKRGKGTTRISNASGTAYAAGRYGPQAVGGTLGGAVGSMFMSPLGPVGTAVGTLAGSAGGVAGGEAINRAIARLRAGGMTSKVQPPRRGPVAPFGSTPFDVFSPTLPSIYDQMFGQ